MWLLLAAAALASPTLQGSTGAVTVPSAETVPARGAVGAFGFHGLQSWAGRGLSPLPMGLAAAIGSRVEVGVRMERDAWSPEPADAHTFTTGAHVRVRAVEPRGARPALAVQGTARGIRSEPVGEVLALATAYTGPATFSAGLGPRLGSERGLDLWTGASASVWASARVELLAEGAMAFQDESVHDWSARAGARVRVHRQIWPMLWAGGGHFDGGAWLGMGLAVGLVSSDPAETDIDRDGVSRRDDACPARPEDIDGFEDADGCPDRDNDGDGIRDEDDPTPDGEPEVVYEGPQFEGPAPLLKLRIDPD